MKYIYLLLIVLFVNTVCFCQAQILDSISLASVKEYNDLDLALKNPDSVIRLSLRKKKYKAFPSQLYAFKNLQYLDISKNSIEELPDSMIVFTNLQVLICNKSGLKKLPDQIGRLKNLKYINVNQNDIERLPYSFGALENLEMADLWSNNLEYFPESMKQMTKLKWMDLRNILIPQNHQDIIQNMVPAAKIYFSPPCKCSW